MRKPIQSAGGIIYYIDRTGKPKFLILKRQALSKKIEWVAPKGKIQGSEDPSDTAIREVCEETGIKRDNLLMKKWLGDIILSLHSEERGTLDKEISYYLIQYIGNPKDINVDLAEGYLGQYRWASIENILRLVYYKNLRDIFNKGYVQIGNQINTKK